MDLLRKTIEYKDRKYQVTGYNLLKNEYNLKDIQTGKYLFEDMDEVKSFCTVLEEG